MTDIVSPEHAAAAASLRRLWSAFEENRDLILMGAYAPGNDPLIDEAIVRRPEILDFLTQAPGEHAPFEASVAALTGMMAQ
jgi:flagellum-specific ATP synthase